MAFEELIAEFNKFYEHTFEVGGFDSLDMKNFLEPVFAREGYREEESSHELLIIHDAGIGDFILLSPSLRAIRKAFPNHRITLVCSSNTRSLARGCPYVDSIFYNDRSFEFQEFESLIRWQINFASKLLPFKFDLAICFCHDIDGYMLAYLSGAKKIVGYKSTALCDSRVWALGIVTDLINYPVIVDPNRPHVIHRYIEIVEGILNRKIDDLELETWFAPRCMKVAREILNEHDFLDKKIFAIVMGGSGLQKHYPPEKYAKLAKKISEEFSDVRFVLLGGSRDFEAGEIFASEFGNSDRVLNLAGKTNLAETAAILSMCSMYIGNDTGMMHVATVFENPCLVPFCFPADKELTPASVIRMYYPLQVPAILVQPKTSLPECIDSHEYFFGCQAYNQPHCITQIEVETMLAGFYLLLEKIQNHDVSVDLIS